jgi:site-specific DNA-cytosine methylase
MWFVKGRRPQSVDDYETWIPGALSTTLNAFDNGGEIRATVLIIFSPRYDEGVRLHKGEQTPTVATYYGTGGSNMPFIATEEFVRRITPMECERLQGFPDNWTATQSDSQRYRQMGNAVTVNVIESIGTQLGKVI